MDDRYLANIENSGYIPSLPLFHDLATAVNIPVERYFYPDKEKLESAEHERLKLKLTYCPEKYLPMEMTADIQKISTNINQIAKRVNATGNVYEQDFAEIGGIIMWKEIVAKAQELIKLAETLAGKTGPEKRAIVVSGMCEAINIPFVPEWLEGLFEPPLYGFIDWGVAFWNRITGH
jgi:transcriptional regulator with XRE-family HTH domain